MYAFVAATLASAALVSAQAGLTINTPSSVVQCQPAALAWTGGTAPYFLSIIPGGQPGAAALETFPDQTGTSFTWTAVDIASGTPITVQIRDSTGTLAYTDTVTIQAGSSTTCVKGGSSGSATPAPSTGSSAAPAGSAAPSVGAATTNTGSSSRPAAASGSAAGSAGAPAASGSSAPSSGAEKVGAGVFGVAVAALFAAFA